MADGSVKIDVGLSLTKAEKDLAKLKEKINKAEDALNANSARKTELEKRLEELGNTAETARKKIKLLREEYDGSRGSERSSIKEQLDRNTANYNATVKDIDTLSHEYQKVDQNIVKGTADLEEMKQQAGAMVQQIEAARPGEALANSFETARKSLAKFLKYSLGIRSVYILFQRLKSWVKGTFDQYVQYDDELRHNIDLLDATKRATRAAIGSGLATIYAAMLPTIQRIANWTLEAANAAAKFIAILSGKSTYKRAIVSTGEISDNMDDTAASAKETRKQIMSFDELNPLGDSGGGSVIGAAKTAKDAIDMVDEAIDTMDNSFISNLALSVRDVLFDWSGLNPEQIAQKAISGLSMLLGAGTGFILGGVPGAITGALLGLTISLVANSAIFDHDGQLSNTEIASMLRIALNGLLGGVIGFTLGGPGGALLGATIGVGFTLLLESIASKSADGATGGIVQSIVDALNYAIAGGVGAAIGFTVGGPGGAAVGAIIGLGLSFAIEQIKASKVWEGQYKDAVSWFIVGVLGLPSDKDWEQWGKLVTDFFTKRFAKWKAVLPKDAAGVALAITIGFIEGLWDAGATVISSIGSWITEHIIDPVKELLGIHSPSTVFSDIARDCVQGLWNGWQEKWNAFITYMQGRWTALKNWWSGLSLDGFRIKTPHLSWSTKQASGWIASTLSALGLPSAIPQLSVQWYARGGIFDRASLIGVGEAGKEAVVPLERNTGWMQMVADGLMERMEQSRFTEQLAEAFVTVPRPVMASGTVAPPRAVTDYSPSAGIEDAVRRGVYDALSISSSGGQGEERQPINVYIGDDKIASYILRVNSRNSLITGGR